MNTVIRGNFVESGRLSQEEIQQARDQLAVRVAPEELERSLAKLSIQLVMESGFTVANHVTCAMPENKERSWFGMIKKIRHEKYKSIEGFDPAGYEIEAICQDLDDIIWKPDNVVELRPYREDLVA